MTVWKKQTAGGSFSWTFSKRTKMRDVSNDSSSYKGVVTTANIIAGGGKYRFL